MQRTAYLLMLVVIPFAVAGCGVRPTPVAPTNHAASVASQTGKSGPTVEKVSDIAAEMMKADRTKVNGQTSLADLGADDLDFVELVMELEEAFGVSIPDERLDGMMGTKDTKEGMKNVTMTKLTQLVKDLKK